MKAKKKALIIFLCCALLLTAMYLVYQERVSQPSYVPFGELEMY